MITISPRESLKREVEGFRHEAEVFLSNLPLNLRVKVERDFVNYLDTKEVDRNLGDKVRNFCLKGSKILQFSNESWEITETIYNDDNTGNFYDEYIVNCKSGRATHNRFTTVVDNVHQLMVKSKATTIWSLGSGVGSDIFKMLMDYPELTNFIEATCFEMDISACVAGSSLASRFGMVNNVRFIGGDFRKTARRLKRVSGGPDLCIMIGVICPMEVQDSIRLLKLIRESLRQDSSLVVSTVMDQMLRDDPFSCYLVHLVMDWRLIFVAPDKFRQMMETAGYIWEDFFADKYGYHGMAICRVP